MSLLRTFIAIELPQSIKEAILSETSGLRERTGHGLVRWVSPDNIHLTLRFLGETSSGTVNQLKGLLTDAAKKYAPIEITIGGFGVFPNRKQPRVLWVGLQYPPALVKLQSEIESLAQHLEFDPENRSFLPHLTLGRVNQKISTSQMQALKSALASMEIGQIGTFTANAIHLIRSDLHPTGAVYSTLASATLSAT